MNNLMRLKKYSSLLIIPGMMMVSGKLGIDTGKISLYYYARMAFCNRRPEYICNRISLTGNAKEFDSAHRKTRMFDRNKNADMKEKTIWTIGHSTHSLEKFIVMLTSFQIEVLVDIRSFPGSRRYPHFNKEALSVSLPENNIGYVHLVELGGRRKPKKDSKNTAWRVEAFRGYADYMETEAFGQAINKLELLGNKKRVAYMCSEAVWWRCHRSLVSDYLKFKGWTVMHIMDMGKAEEHPYTKPARIEGAHLVYSA